MTHKTNQGFTLTELLVVVVIIGVLAAVVLPKFTKIIETRKTTEAEEMMTAVRNEQEARCTLGKNYKEDITQLKVYAGSAASKNFEYGPKVQNFDGTDKIVGIIASAKGKGYKLEIPSYADGRICCSENEAGNGACAALNKNYPLCSDLTDTTKTANYVAPNEGCGVEPAEIAEIPGPCEPDTPQPSNQSITKEEDGCTYTITYTWKADPICDWIPQEKKETCPEPQVCTPGTTQSKEGTCKCGKTELEICKEDGSGWEPTEGEGECALTDDEKTNCECDETPQKTISCQEYFSNIYGYTPEEIIDFGLDFYESEEEKPFKLKRTCVDGKWENKREDRELSWEPETYEGVCNARTAFTCEEWKTRSANIPEPKTCGEDKYWKQPFPSGRFTAQEFDKGCCNYEYKYFWVEYNAGGRTSGVCEFSGLNDEPAPRWHGKCNCGEASVGTTISYPQTSESTDRDTAGNIYGQGRTYCANGSNPCYSFGWKGTGGTGATSIYGNLGANLFRPYSLPADFFSMPCNQSNKGKIICMELLFDGADGNPPAPFHFKVASEYECTSKRI